jgi:hypothetical protein
VVIRDAADVSHCRRALLATILPDISSALPDITAGRRLLARVLGRRDVPEPVAAWRAVPEDALRNLTVAEKKAYIGALLPLMRDGRRIERRKVRRLYQLFAFMEMPAEARLELVAATHTRLRLAPESLPHFSDKRVRHSLLDEAIAIAGRAPSNEAKGYIARLGAHLGVRPGDSAKWTRLFEKLTDIENRAAGMLGKTSHIVRLNDRKLETFKKAVASVGVPAAVLFPLGTVGLSAEGITTGLIALGGGFLLPTGIAMATGVGVAVAIGISTKKILDMAMPTMDSDRLSIDIEKLNAEAIEIERALDAIDGEAPDRQRIEDARARIAHMIREMVPLSERDRAKLQEAFDHARILGDRYLDYLAQDREFLESRNHVAAQDVASLLDYDSSAIQRS